MSYLLLESEIHDRATETVGHACVLSLENKDVEMWMGGVGARVGWTERESQGEEEVDNGR